MILVAGGTGRLGALVTGRLVDRGLGVRVLTRDPARAGGLPHAVEVAVGDVRDRASLAAAMEGADCVVSAIHGFAGPGGGTPATVDRDGNANVVDAAAEEGAEVVLVSVVGAAPDSPMELFAMKYAAEQYLLQSAVPATIVRATAFVELWAELLRKTAARSGRPVVFGRGDNPVNFVCVGDVAAAVEYAVIDRSCRGAIMEVGSPDNLTLNTLAAMVQAADKRTGAPRHLRPLLLRALAGSIGALQPALGRQLRAALAMDNAALAFDPTSMRSLRPGLPCTPVASCLS
jgi:uncharacterized protein YbjT (DUF2867 family)